MSKPILRVGKLKATGARGLAAVDGHLSRTRPTHNADPERTDGNRWLVGGPGTLQDRVHGVLGKAGIDPGRLRRDATIANDLVLTVSPDWFRPEDPDEHGAYDPAKLEAFQGAALAFLRQQFGPRLAAVVVHLDEATPHVQAVVVPVMKKPDGTHRLSGRDYFGPDRLAVLQDAWQKRLEPLGVGPRTVGSTARHRTIKSYYSALQAAPEVPEPQPPSPPPLRALVPGGGDAMAAWQAGEVAKVRKRQKPLAAAAAKGMLYEAERHAADLARGHAQDQERRLGAMRAELAQAQDEVALTKDQVARLRGVPVHEVAAVLGYVGELGKRENAIDLVKRVGGFSFEEATRWLSTAFGPAAAGAAAAQHMAMVPTRVSEAPLTPADQVKARAVREQLDALGAPAYRVTVMHQHEDGSKHGLNLCKPRGAGKDQAERLWSQAEVVARIPQLTAENARGGNVYVTPVDPAVYHALLDDLDETGVASLKADGYRPTTVTETSPGNRQVVLTVPRSLGYGPVNEWFKAMNRERGDERIVGLEHSMRLAGFQNRKARYEDGGRYPFVRVLEAARGMCAHARAVITGMARQMREGVSSRDENTTPPPPPPPGP